MQARRSEGLSSFPEQLPLRSTCLALGQKPPATDAHFLSLAALVFLYSFDRASFPTVIGLFSDTDLSDCVNLGHNLPYQNFNLS